jgi:hypothetical protein
MRPTCLTLQNLRDVTYTQLNITKPEPSHLPGSESGRKDPEKGVEVNLEPNLIAAAPRKKKYTICETCGEKVYVTPAGEVSHTSRFLDAQCASR